VLSSHYLSDISKKDEKEADMTRSDTHIFNPNDYYGFHPPSLRDHFEAIDHQGGSPGAAFSLLVSVPGDLRSSILDASHSGGRCQSVQQIFQRVERKQFLAKEHFLKFLYQKYQRNCKSKTLSNYCATVIAFLSFVEQSGKGQLAELDKQDLEAFIEHEQDRGLKPASLRLRVVSIRSFLQYLLEADKIGPEILRRKIQVKLPKALPRAMDPMDVKRLLAVVRDVRDRAMMLVMLRTGLRIGEVLDLKVTDVQMSERKILVYEGEKNHIGRVVCLSSDAHEALQQWLFIRDSAIEIVFYSRRRRPMAYTTAREIFIKYLKKAELSHKRYSLHSLRHTFATDLLNAGMRLECLQQQLGHSSLEMTLRYAKLSDKTREEEYFKAMAIIEGEKIHEPEQLDHQLPASFKTPKLFSQHP
jgi:site-specific recombinase XerD